MIRTILIDCQWGTEPIDDGIQINVRDGDSGMIFHVPFEGDALKQLATDIFSTLTEPQKTEILSVAFPDDRRYTR